MSHVNDGILYTRPLDDEILPYEAVCNDEDGDILTCKVTCNISMYDVYV